MNDWGEIEGDNLTFWYSVVIRVSSVMEGMREKLCFRTISNN